MSDSPDWKAVLLTIRKVATSKDTAFGQSRALYDALQACAPFAGDWYTEQVWKAAGCGDVHHRRRWARPNVEVIEAGVAGHQGVIVPIDRP